MREAFALYNDVVSFEQLGPDTQFTLETNFSQIYGITVGLQFNSHKSVQKLFHNLHIIFTNSLMDFKVICQLEKEPLKGLANVQEIFS